MRVRMAIPAFAKRQRLGHDAALVAAFAFNLSMPALQGIVRALVIESLPRQPHAKPIRRVTTDAVGPQPAQMDVLMAVRAIIKSQSLILCGRILTCFLGYKSHRQRRRSLLGGMAFGAAGIPVLAG